MQAKDQVIRWVKLLSVVNMYKVCGDVIHRHIHKRALYTVTMGRMWCTWFAVIQNKNTNKWNEKDPLMFLCMQLSRGLSGSSGLCWCGNPQTRSGKNGYKSSMCPGMWGSSQGWAGMPQREVNTDLFIQIVLLFGHICMTFCSYLQLLSVTFCTIPYFFVFVFAQTGEHEPTESGTFKDGARTDES